MRQQRRRVLFVDHTGAPSGGGQLSAARLLPRLTRIDPVVLLLSGGDNADTLRSQGVEVVELTDHRSFSHRNGPAMLRALRRAVKGKKADAIVALSTASAQYVSLLPRSKTPWILRLSEDMARYRDGGFKQLTYFRFIFPRFDGFIANSRWTASTVPESLARRPMTVAYPLSGLPEQPAPRKRVFAEDGVVRIASFSRLVPWKGIDLAIAAVAEAGQRSRLPLRLDIFGGSNDTDHIAQLQSSIDDHGIDAVLRGRVGDVLAEMSKADIVVIPSRLPEPFGQVTAQALSRGCITIVSDSGGALELISHRLNGLTFTTGSAHALAEQLVTVIDDPTLAASLSRQATAVATEFSDSAATEQFELGIEEILTRLGRGTDSVKG